MMEFEDKGLTIQLFPVNTLNYQEKRSGQRLKEFLKQKYNANFKIFDKCEISGKNTNEVYRWLRLNSELGGGPNRAKKIPFPWNYGKFLVNNDGIVEKFISGLKSPLELHDIIYKQLNGEEPKSSVSINHQK